jgi:replicative DNA helicase
VSDRTLPHDLEAERAVLGAVLLRNDLCEELGLTLQPADFYRDAHQRLWAAFTALNARREPIDLVTLRDTLGAPGELDRVGGPSYVAALTDALPRSTNAPHYAAIVVKHARLRRLVQAARRLEQQALAEDSDPDTVLQQVEQTLLEARQERRGVDFRTAEEVARDVYGRLELMLDASETVWGLPTGFRDLDSLTRGLLPQQLVVLAARPSQGKSAFMVNLADHVAATGRRVAIFSLEMSDEELGLRAILGSAALGSHRLTRGGLTESEYGRLSQAYTRLASLPIYYCDDARLTIPEIRSRCRRLKAGPGLDLVAVDYVQLMAGTGRRQNRQEEVTEISRGLKHLAKELDVPVIALSQVNRECERRDNKRPMLSDLRESGSLEQDADMVWLLFREEVYRATPANTGLAELIVAKQRNGPTGIVELHWRKDIMRFSDREWRAA